MNHGRCLIGLTRMARCNMTRYSQPSAARDSDRLLRTRLSARFQTSSRPKAGESSDQLTNKAAERSPLNALSLLLLLLPE